MSTPTGPDPIDQLRAADPVRADGVPDASLARVSARIQEHVMTDIQHDPAARRSRGPLAWVGGLALVGALALAIRRLSRGTPPPRRPLSRRRSRGCNRTN